MYGPPAIPTYGPPVVTTHGPPAATTHGPLAVTTHTLPAVALHAPPVTVTQTIPTAFQWAFPTKNYDHGASELTMKYLREDPAQILRDADWDAHCLIKQLNEELYEKAIQTRTVFNPVLPPPVSRLSLYSVHYSDQHAVFKVMGQEARKIPGATARWYHDLILTIGDEALPSACRVCSRHSLWLIMLFMLSLEPATTGRPSNDGC